MGGVAAKIQLKKRPILILFLLNKNSKSAGVVANTCNPGTLEAEAGSLDLR